MKKLIPAPIDGKNILTDWIDTMFDNAHTVCNDTETCVLGFINNLSAQCCKFGDNELMWFCNNEENAKEIEERLLHLEMDERTAMSISVSGSTITQKFYFLED